jgi:thioredoxin 1
MGIDVSIDRDVRAGESLTHFMETAIRECDVVLVVCTPQYAEKANHRIGGVGYETGVVTGELVDAASSDKFVPILRTGSRRDSVPSYLRDRKAIDFRIEDGYRVSLEELAERCGGALDPPPPPSPPTEELLLREGAVIGDGTFAAEETVAPEPVPVPSLKTSALQQMLAKEKPVVVEFWAPWCGPCRVLSPVVDEIAGEYSASTEFARLNVDEEQQFSAEYEVLSIPTVIVFENQKPTKKIVGAMPKRRLLAELDEHIGEPNPDEEELAAHETVALTWHEGRIKAVILNRDGTYAYVSADARRHGLVYLPSLVKTGFSQAIAELEELINSSYTTKDEIRRFLEAHPDLILGGDYHTAHSQVLLRREGMQSLQPDFLVEPVAGELADVVEVEPAQREIATQSEGVTELTDVVVQACSRLREYRDYFESEKHRVEIEDDRGIRVFRPRMFVVIGRSGQTDSLTQRRLEAQLPDVSLRSWDDVLAVARKRLDA